MGDVKSAQLLYPLVLNSMPIFMVKENNSPILMVFLILG